MQDYYNPGVLLVGRLTRLAVSMPRRPRNREASLRKASVGIGFRIECRIV